MTKTIRSQFEYEIGSIVEGFTILEKHTVIPPVPLGRRRGIYDYLVDVPPIPVPMNKMANPLRHPIITAVLFQRVAVGFR
jgi:hypothetical protein